MITFFTIPKRPDSALISTIQANAITSWLRLTVPSEVIVFAADGSVEEFAQALGARCVRVKLRSPEGTPLLDEAFLTAQSLARFDVLCYVNTDIILTDDLIRATQRAVRLWKRFVLIGKRWDLDLSRLLTFDTECVHALRTEVRNAGSLHATTGMDYFVFPNGLWEDFPPFRVGRAGWDNWVPYGARSAGAVVCDCSAIVTAIHQNHDYSHCGGRYQAYKGPEAQMNRQIAGFPATFSTISDATHALTCSGVMRRCRSCVPYCVCHDDFFDQRAAFDRTR